MALFRKQSQRGLSFCFNEDVNSCKVLNIANDLLMDGVGGRESQLSLSAAVESFSSDEFR